MDRGVILYEYIAWIIICFIYRPNFCIQNLQVVVSRIPILLSLKIPVYQVYPSPPIILEISPDHYPNILPTGISLDILWVLFRGRDTEAPFSLFSTTPLQKTLIIPYNHSLFICYLVAPCFVLLIACLHGFLCEQRTLGCNLISNVITLEDIAYYFMGAGYPRGFFQLGKCLFRVLARVAQ
jgi:hypothetical protein